MSLLTAKVPDFFNRLRSSAFLKNLAVVMFGTAMAQLIGFAISPIISRLFSPSDFGIFGSFSAVSGVIAAGVTLEYTQAVMLPKDSKDAINLFFVSCVATAFIAMLCLLACLVAPGRMLGLMKAPSAWILGLLVLATLVNGFNSACQAWNVRVKAFKQTSVSQVVRSLSANAAQIGCGYFRAGAAGLIWASVLADLIATFNLLGVVLRDLKHLFHHVRWERMKQLAKEYRDFPMYSASQNVTNATSEGVPILLLTHFYGIGVAGAYAFGVRILWAPMGLLLRAMRQVLFQKACETHHRGDSLVSLYVKITAALFAIASVPSLILFIWAPQIFTWVFGARWLTAGEFARSLVLWCLFSSCNLPAVLFARLIRIQRTIFFYDLLLLAVRVLVLVLAGLYLSAGYTIVAFSVVGAAMNFFLILLVGYALMKKEGLITPEGARSWLMKASFAPPVEMAVKEQ